MSRRIPELTIDLSCLGTPSAVITPSTRDEYIQALEAYYPEIVSLLNILNPPLKILFNDLDGTVTNTAGGEVGSAYALVAPDHPFIGEEQPVEIGPDHPLFEGHFDQLQEFYHNLASNGVLVIPVTQNYGGVTRLIMEQLVGIPCPGWYASSLSSPSATGPPQLISKVQFMTAVCSYLENPACCLFIDDNYDEINWARGTPDLPETFQSRHVRPWLGVNSELRGEINDFFGLN